MSLALGEGLAGRSVIVTGAAGGIGRAIAEGLADAGARLVITDVHEGPLSEVAEALGGGHASIPMDLRDADAPSRLVAAADELGPFRGVAHSAAVLIRRPTLDDITEADWDLQLDVNLKAAFMLLRAAGRRLVEQGDGGRLVALTSQGWWTGGFGGSGVYAAAKGGIVSLCRNLARNLGPHGITVNTIAPGAVDTPMYHTDLSAEAADLTMRQIPLGRIAAPSEIAPAAVFLMSDNAAYVTGATVNLSGGMLMY